MQSEQARQWRRERKRLKREERQRAVQPPADVTISLRALPPMGDTLVEYARPLIDALLPADYGPDELWAALLVAAIFWNVLLDEEEVDETVPILAGKLEEKLQMPITEAYRLSEALADRRVRLFGNDPRIVENIEVSGERDRLRVTARSTVVRQCGRHRQLPEQGESGQLADQRHQADDARPPEPHAPGSGVSDPGPVRRLDRGVRQDRRPGGPIARARGESPAR